MTSGAPRLPGLPGILLRHGDGLAGVVGFVDGNRTLEIFCMRRRSTRVLRRPRDEAPLEPQSGLSRSRDAVTPAFALGTIALDRYRHAMRTWPLWTLLLVGACPQPVDDGDADGRGEGEGEGENGPLASCQDDDVDIGEECDRADFADVSCVSLGYESGTLQCDSRCLLDRRGCVPQPDCGDGTLNTSERCEGLELRGETCESQGRGQGSVGCRDDCTLDFSACQLCGNGFIEAGEICDGPRVDGRTCASEHGSTATGVLACNSRCDDIDSSECELPFGGSCDSGDRCAEFRFSAPGLAESACTAVAGVFSADQPCDIDAAIGACTTTFARGATPDETQIYFHDGDEEESCTSVGGVWRDL